MASITEWTSSGKGRTACTTTLRLVAAVHDELEVLLSASSSEQWLCRGEGWSGITTWKKSKGSRLEKVVAGLCRCGITTVLRARKAPYGGFFAPGRRGQKRKHIIEESTRQGSEGEDSGPSTSHEEGIEQASLQSIPHLHELGGVKGRYLPHAVHNPSEHAIAVTLGRILVWGTVNAAPGRTLKGLMTQMCLANVALGEKYHGHWFTSLFAGIAARLCQRLTHCRFNDMPPNLLFSICIPFGMGWHNSS